MDVDPVPIVKPTSNGEHAKVDEAIDQMISEMGQTNMGKISNEISTGLGSGPIMGPPQLQTYQNHMARGVNSPHSVSSVTSGNQEHPASPMASISPAPSPVSQPTQYQALNSPVNPVSPHQNSLSPHQRATMTPSPQNVMSPQNIISPHNSRPSSASSYNQVLSPQPNATSPMPLASRQMLPTHANKSFLTVPNSHQPVAARQFSAQPASHFPNGTGMSQNNMVGFNGNKEPYNPFSHTNVMGSQGSPDLQHQQQQQQLQQQQILQQQQLLGNQLGNQGHFPHNPNPFQNF